MFTGEEDVDLEEEIVQKEISGSKVIDDLLYQLLFKNLDSDYCKIIYEMYKDTLKTCNEEWYVYTGTVWKKVLKGDPAHIKEGMDKIISLLKSLKESEEKNKQKYFKTMKKSLIQIEKRLCKNNEERVFGKAMKKYFNDDEFMNKLDKKKNLIAFENGVYDIKTQIFRDGLAEDYLSKKLEYNWEGSVDGDEKTVFVNKVIEDILPDPEQRNYLMKAIASCLEGSNKECKFFINTGKGRNGKNLLYDFVGTTLGEFFVVMEPSFVTKPREKANEANEAFMAAEGRRLICLSEPNKRDIIQSDIMKKYTGDKHIRARANHSKSVEFEICFKMFLLCNGIPLLDKCDHAEFERLSVIKFESYFTENPKNKCDKKIDRDLPEKLSSCKAQMFNVLMGYYIEEGLIMPTRIKNNTLIYREKIKNADDVNSYIQERLCQNLEGQLRCKELWNDYIKWCVDNSKRRAKQCDLEDGIEVMFDVDKSMVHGGVSAYKGIEFRVFPPE
jgi:P4 family phage/plasmid primase-like protien